MRIRDFVKYLQSVKSNLLNKEKIQEPKKCSRREFGKIISIVPYFTSIAPQAAVQILENMNGVDSVSKMFQPTENDLYNQLLQWVFYKQTPTLVHKTKAYNRIVKYKTLLPYNKYQESIIEIFSRAHKMLGQLESSVHGINSLPSGHETLSHVCEPAARSIAFDEHINDCPHCIGLWVQNRMNDVPMYENFLERYRESVSLIKNQIPFLTRENIINQIALQQDFFNDHEEAFHSTLNSNFFLTNPSDLFNQLKEFISSKSDREIKERFTRTLDEQLLSFETWVKKLAAASRKLKKLPELLKRSELIATKQDNEIISGIENRTKRNLLNALSNKSGIFIIQGDIELDDYNFIQHVINNEPNLKNITLKKEHWQKEHRHKKHPTSLKDMPNLVYIEKNILFKLQANEMVEKIKDTCVSLKFTDLFNLLEKEHIFISPEVLGGVQAAFKVIAEANEKNIGVTIPGTLPHDVRYAKFYAHEIYFLNLIAEEVKNSLNVNLNFVYSMKNPKQSCSELRYSDFICEWGKNQNAGIVIYTPSTLIGYGMRRKLNEKYEKEFHG